ncbi:MAG TPA: hypothetical protein VFG33_34895 [Kribbella sp.]|uniref:hypothetical protein n=1 Tax=Kribbella sp. TaxID=1871183 RepID=UPI002D77B673|nr:hypothetical protein [Kribbella sp.]HET6298613.1 hypothetical protein [Kribbella sp.]
MNHHHQPVPPATQYPKSTAAARRSVARTNVPALIVALCVLAMLMIVAGVVAWDANSARAGDTVAHVAPPASQPGPAVPQPVEKSPPLLEKIPGDGTWLLGAEIKRGTYKSAGGFTCYWARLADLTGEYGAILSNGFARPGPQKVALGPEVAALATSGCGPWELIK